MPASPAQQRLGRYRLEGERGRGGMGVVHVAYDEGHDRRVALKVLRSAAGDLDPAAADRFAQEMRIAVALEHPNVVPVYETGTDGDVRFIAMRLVDGEDLGAVIRREGPLRPDRVARLGRQLGAALDAAHAHGLVHRDVKPGNVLLTGSGDEEHVYLTDFGLTRAADGGVTQTGQWIGTVDYAAPEQIEARPVEPRTDVYALGCVLFHALTGRPPFTGSLAARATAHVTAPLPTVGPVVPDPERIDAVLAVATAKDPARRHASAGALARAFARAVAESADDQATAAHALPPVAEEEHEAPTTVQRTPRLPLPVGVPRPREEPPSPRATGDPDPDGRTAVRRGQGPLFAGGRPPEADRPDPVPAPAAGPRDRRGPLLLLGAAGAVLAAVLVLALGAGGDEEPAGTSAGTSSGRSGETKAKAGSTGTSAPTQATTAAPAPKPAAAPARIVPLPTTSYTAPTGGYTADVPSGEGWAVRGEENVGGILRTTVTGPDGAQLWIDATPTMAPSFGREGRTVTEERTLQGPLGPIAGYRFTGVPVEFCGGGCADYQLDLGGKGFAVIAGPTPRARLAARRTILSLKPAAAPVADAPPPAAAAPVDGAKPGKGGKGKKDK